MNLDKSLTRIRDWLQKPWLVGLLLTLSILRTLPSLGNGFFLDDHIHRAMVQQDADLPWDDQPAWGLFEIFPDDDAFRTELFEQGILPWWASQDFKLSFWRPLTSLTHALDYTAWPEHPALMHLHSTLWFMALLAVALAVYRRFLGPPWLWGLAVVLFAFDDLHALPVGWLANRHALLSAVFGFLALLAHDAWRRDGWRAGMILGPLLLGVALASGEFAVGALAYVVGYAVCLDEGSWRARAASAAPYLLIALAWQIAWRTQGHGAAGSGMILDLARSPLDFATALGVRTPVLMLGQFGAPASEVHSALSGELQVAHSVVGWLWIGGIAAVAWPLIRRDRTARFWALSVVLATLSVSAGIVHDRVMLMAALGSMGLIAQMVQVAVEAPDWRPEATWWRRGLGVFVAASIGLHLIVAPLSMPAKAAGVRIFGDLIEGPGLAFEAGPELRSQTLIVVNAQPGFLETYFSASRASAGKPVPARLRCLGVTDRAVSIHREDEHTIVLQVDEGYLEDDAADMMREAEQRYDAGWTVTLSDVSIEVLESSEDGRPTRIRARFKKPLGDPSHRWIAGRESGLEPFDLPPVGQTVSEPAVETSPIW